MKDTELIRKKTALAFFKKLRETRGNADPFELLEASIQETSERMNLNKDTIYKILSLACISKEIYG